MAYTAYTGSRVKSLHGFRCHLGSCWCGTSAIPWWRPHQPTGGMESLNFFLGGLDRNSDRMARIKHMMLTGCGTSMNASMFGAKVTRPHLLSRISRARSRARLTRESALLRQLMRELGSFETAVAMDSAEARAIAARFRHACI